MGTPAILHVKQPGGKVLSICIHNDGYPSHTGSILKQHYNSNELANCLIIGGSFSLLEKQLQHLKRYNKKENMAKTFPNLNKSIDKWGERYNYYWDGVEWYLICPFNTKFPLKTMTHIRE